MPTKESTAAVLLLLITGDIIAVARFRRHADWGLLIRLLPSVLPGVALGALFMSAVDDVTLRRFIGSFLLASVALSLLLRWRGRDQRATATGGASKAPIGPAQTGPPRALASIGAGTAAGFTTMTANAAAPVMTLYLLAARVDKRAFVGTNAWFFLLVNLSKTPFSAALGLFPASTLRLTVVLVPFVLIGTWLGSRLTHRLSQQQFEAVALAASAVGAVLLLVR